MRQAGFAVLFAAFSVAVLVAALTVDRPQRLRPFEVESSELRELIPLDGVLADFKLEAPDFNPGPAAPPPPDFPYHVVAYSDEEDNRFLIGIFVNGTRARAAVGSVEDICERWRELAPDVPCPVREIDAAKVGDYSMAFLSGDPARDLVRSDTFVRDGVRVSLTTMTSTQAVRDLAPILLAEIDQRIQAFVAARFAD